MFCVNKISFRKKRRMGSVGKNGQLASDDVKSFSASSVAEDAFGGSDAIGSDNCHFLKDTKME